jgi:hypothetical protein
MSGKWKASIAVATAAVAAPAAGVLAHDLGGGDRPGQAPLPGVATAPLHAVGAGAAPVGAKASGGSRASKRVGLAYLQTKRQTVPPGRSSLRVGPTPRKCRAINGYYFIPNQQQTNITSEGDSLGGYRHWIFYRDNRTANPVKRVVYGVVCIRGARLIGVP